MGGSLLCPPRRPSAPRTASAGWAPAAPLGWPSPAAERGGALLPGRFPTAYRLHLHLLSELMSPQSSSPPPPPGGWAISLEMAAELCPSNSQQGRGQGSRQQWGVGASPLGAGPQGGSHWAASCFPPSPPIPPWQRCVRVSLVSFELGSHVGASPLTCSPPTAAQHCPVSSRGACRAHSSHVPALSQGW